MTWIAPEDQAQRDQAIAPSLSVHVEAPAGSGKTTVLMKRYLALLAQVREPEEILALTFTRKAAGELRARVQNELTKREEPGEADNLAPHEAELRDLALAAASRHIEKGMSLLERLQVSTFHGFCAQLLRLIPHQTGLPPDFKLLEETESKRLQQEAVALVGRRLQTKPASDPVRQALVRRLVRLNNNWPRLAGELQGLLSRRDILGEFITLARQSRDPAAYEGVLREHLRTMIQPRLIQLAREFGRADLGQRWPEIYRCLAETGAGLAETLPETIPGSGLDDLDAWRTLAQGILKKDGECYKQFSKPKFSPGFKKSECCRLLAEVPAGLVGQLNFFRELSPILLPEDEVAAVTDLILLLHQALNTYEELCASHRSLDFTGLEQVALQVLSDDDLPELWRRLDRRLNHLLVDEYQDTSVNQMHLLCRLLAGWQGDRKRSLMVVGDPKQSIYGWRQARLELFFRSRDGKRLPDCPEAPAFTTLTLKTNFRSTRTLIDWANQVFGQTIMAERQESGVDFKAATAQPGAEAGSPPDLTLFSGPEARIREADWLAGELARLQRLLGPKETVGVLLFTRTHLATYLEAWRRAGLSLRVKDGLPLGDSLGVRHLHNLATALVRPHDDLAWAALLRGWAGPQPLGRLAEIAPRPGDFWSEKIRRYAAAPDGHPAVKRLSQDLAAARKRVGREPLETVLADCLDRLKGWERLAAWEGPQGVANARAYLDLLAAAAAATPEATLVQAGDLLAQAYQPPDPRAQDSPVEVLTVHAAKGLEYDHVFLPYVDWQPLRTAKNDAPFLMEEMPEGGTAIIALNRAFLETQQSVLYQTLKATAQQRALGEARRLFYVAMTRAKKRLHMSGVINSDKNGEWKFPDKSPLGWVGEHYEGAGLCSGLVNLWQAPPLAVNLDPEVSVLLAEPMEPGPVPPPYELRPEPFPYEIRFPSQIAAEQGDEAGTEASSSSPRGVAEGSEPDQAARLRGDISHRLLENLSAGGALPDPAIVAPALRQVTGSGDAALKLAEEIVSEIKACQEDPFLGPLLSPDLPVARSEWLVEAWAGPAVNGLTPHPDPLPSSGEGKEGTALLGGARSETRMGCPILYRGQIDRLVFDGRQWWLLDYKTSRPAAGVDWEDFMAAEADHYRPQLLAYREMAAQFYTVEPPEVINCVLYFTAGQRHILL